MSYLIPEALKNEILKVYDEAVFVDPSGSDSLPNNGSPTLPFATIQKGVDTVEAAGSGTVIIGPGIYDETVYIKKTRIHLWGTGGQGHTSCQIRPSSGPALVLTNATLATIQPWIAGGPGLYDANYGTLVADAGYPHDNQIRNVDLFPQSNTEYAVVMAGVGAGTSFGGNELRMTNCALRNGNNSLSLWARLTNYIVAEIQTWLAGATRLRNVAGFWVNNCQISSVESYYITTEDEPADNGNYGLSGFFVLRGNLNLRNEAHAGFDKLFNPHIEGNVNLYDESRCRIHGGVIEGNLYANTDADFDFSGVHIEGNVTIDSGGGDPPCTMTGCGFLGVLTDDGRLTDTRYTNAAIPVQQQMLFVQDNDDVTGVESTKFLAKFPFNPTDWGTGLSFYFGATLAVSDALRTGEVKLRNLSAGGGVGEDVTLGPLTTSSTSYVKLESGALTVGVAAGNLKNSEQIYEVRIYNDGTLAAEKTFIGSAWMRIA